MEQPRPSPAKRALHVFVLASMAAAPVLVVTDAQFFIGRGASAGEVAGVALIMMIAVPAALALLGYIVSALSDVVGWVFHLFLIGGLSALIVSVALYPLNVRIELQVALVAVAGVVAALVYARFEWAQSIASALAVLPFVVLAYVFFLTPISGLVFTGEPEIEAKAANTSVETPVVMVVFDEFPGHALMDAKGRLDAKRFPNFAALGEDTTWYPNATTSRGDTELAVPTLATGIHAPLDTLGTATDHPESLFTLLGPTHEMHVSEPWTNLCPDELCDGSTDSTDEGGIGSLLATMPTILGQLAVPDAARLGIPSPRESGAVSRPGQVNTFTEEIEAADEPFLHFLHVLLPHQSWWYLPAGERYEDTVGTDAEFGRFAEWGDDPWPVLQSQQRFFLQLQYTDKLLGGLLDRLRSQGLYEEAVIVVTADHGVSFTAGDEGRDATGTNSADILSVPLFVKLPDQRKGVVDEAPARTVDVVPTIADAIGADIPWEVDGESLLGGDLPDRPVEIETLIGGRVELTQTEYQETLAAALERRVKTLGDGEENLYAIGPEPKLQGQSVESLLGKESAGSATIIDGVDVRDYDQESAVTPARIGGDLGGIEAHEPLAVALNGRVAATTYAYDGDFGTEFAALVPPKLIEPGDNELEVLAIEGEGDGLELRALDVSYSD